MSALSDTITLGLVLILVFGSACLYLYTRIQQAETKINLLESILLDLKMTNELKAYPTMSYPVMSEDDTRVHIVQEKEVSIAPFESMTEDEAAPVEVQPFEDDQDKDQEHIGITDDKASVKVTPNYEAMTLSELKAIAKQKGISGVSSMRRAQILEALKKAIEQPAHVSVLDSLSGEVSSITEMSQPLDVGPAPNAELA